MPRNYDYLEVGVSGSLFGAFSGIYIAFIYAVAFDDNNPRFPYGLFIAGSAVAGSAFFIVAVHCERRRHPNSNERRYRARDLSREDLLALKKLHDNIENKVNSDNSDTDKAEEIYKSFQEYISTSLRRGSHYNAIQSLERDKNYLYVGMFEEQKLQLIKDCLEEVVLEL